MDRRSFLSFTDELTKIAGMEKTAKVSPYQQKTQWSCSAGCMRAVLKHYDLDVPEAVLIKAIGTRKNRGAETTEIVQAAKKLGFDSYEKGFENLAEVKGLLAQDIPIICDIQSYKNPGKGHYVVLTGVTDDDVAQIMDPNVKKNWREEPLEVFDQRWFDYGMFEPDRLMKRWGVVILPPGVKGNPREEKK